MLRVRLLLDHCSILVSISSMLILWSLSSNRPFQWCKYNFEKLKLIFSSSHDLSMVFLQERGLGTTKSEWFSTRVQKGKEKHRSVQNGTCQKGKEKHIPRAMGEGERRGSGTLAQCSQRSATSFSVEGLGRQEQLLPATIWTCVWLYDLLIARTLIQI